MLKKYLKTSALVAGLLCAGFTSAHAWTLDGEASKLAYGSIKKDTVGEVNTFEKLDGSVSADGTVEINIDLLSLETNIDIRNERMAKYVFGDATKAVLSATVDIAEFNNLAVGDSTTTDLEGKLAFAGASIDIETELFVARLSDTRVLVTTNDLVFVSTEDLGVTAGIDKLMELAKLSGITRTVPIVARFVFNNDQKKAEAPAESPKKVALAVTGDVKAGKKVFKKCSACHTVKEGKNKVGPTLYKIVGAKAGAVEGYKYSKAMANSGLTWDAETLSAFLAKPKEVVKGNKMAFRGLKKEKDIENLIAYLADQ